MAELKHILRVIKAWQGDKYISLNNSWSWSQGPGCENILLVCLCNKVANLLQFGSDPMLVCVHNRVVEIYCSTLSRKDIALREGESHIAVIKQFTLSGPQINVLSVLDSFKV